jgi:ABC-type uncharacterized transport system involved in gliding motility auxiliary subunit
MEMKSTMNRFWKVTGGFAGLIVFLVILVTINIIVTQFRLRKDLTEERLYTLSDGTRKVLSKLDRDVTLMFFFNASSPEVPAPLKDFARQVEDLLREYEVAGGGHVTLEKYDPKPDSDAEDLAMRFGINGQAIPRSGGMIYLGLVAVSGDMQAAIPLIDPSTEELLEYNVTRMLYRVSTPRKPVVGVLSTLPVMGSSPPMMMPGQRPQRTQPWAAFSELAQDYTLRMVEPSAETINPDIDALVVVHPKDLTDRTQFAIDQFVLRGGRLLAFVDPLCAVDQDAEAMNPYGMGAKRSSTLDKLFDAWGVKFEQGKVLADLKAATPLRGQNNTVENSPLYLSLREPNMAPGDIVTSPIKSALMVMAGAFGNEAAEGLTLTPLIRSSDQSVLADAMMMQFDPSAFKRQFQQGHKQYNLAIRLQGTFKTAFPNGMPATPGDTNRVASSQIGLKESKSPGTVVLVADADLLSNDFSVRDIGFFGVMQPINDNLNLFANLIEQQAGSSDLIGIRCRGRTQRPFSRVLALEAEAQGKWMQQEQIIEERLRTTQQRMEELQRQKDDKQRFVMSPEQARELDGFRQEVLKYRADLKNVRRNLREGIEALGMKVKLINILLVPALVAAAGLLFAIIRKTVKR